MADVSRRHLRKLASVIAYFLAIIGGGVLVFMTAGPALFNDGALHERIIVLGISVLGFGVLGIALGALAPQRWRRESFCSLAPLVVAIAFFGAEVFAQLQFALLALGFVVGDAAAVLGGSLIGVRLRNRLEAYLDAREQAI